MTQDSQRYSDKRLADDFTIYVLFSEPLKGTVAEILEAVAEDYPGIDWSSSQIGGEIDTQGVTLSTDLGISKDEARGRTTFMGMPGRCELDWTPIFEMSRIVNPEAEQAVLRHTDHLSISVGSPQGNTSVAARFDAARRLTCLGAVFAKLPITLGVYFPSADLLVKPEDWVSAAETAMKGEVPVMQWMALYVNQFQWDGPAPEPVTVGTIGLAAFNGHELVMPQVQLPAGDAAHWIYMTVRMLLEAGHEFADGNTLGVEGQGKPIRIRLVAEGAETGGQTDQWFLFHEASLLDDEKVLGPRGGRPPPPGVDNSIMGDWDDLKNKLYSFVAGGR
ncbi:MAG: hypothetical protein AAGA87_10385 [Pseudomonadota bacterium]